MMRWMIMIACAALLFCGIVAAQDFRKATVDLTVTDSRGRAYTGAVAVKQAAHEFLFGANNSAIQSEALFDKYRSVFNAVALMTFWTQYDAGKGQYNAAAVSSSVYLMNRFADAGLYVAGHPILYRLDVAEPAWARNDKTAYSEHLQWWIKTFSRVSIADILNEPKHEPIAFPWTEPHAWTKIQRPALLRRVNEYGLLTGEITDEWVSTLKNNADAFEIIGVQCHWFAQLRNGRLPDIEVVRRNLAKLATVGKPIHITEISVPSGAFGYTEALQAEWVRTLYETFWATPAVTGIFYWDLSDAGAWNPTSGLWRADGTGRPAWDAVSTLINQTWNSTGVITAKNGRATFTGYRGRYVINGKTYDTAAPSWRVAMK
jgi:GH35 family endo-1,4-beta-xylanase